MAPKKTASPSFAQHVGRGATAAIVGGTASVIGGGKFANGAVTAAFVYAFNARGGGPGMGHNGGPSLEDATGRIGFGAILRRIPFIGTLAGLFVPSDPIGLDFPYDYNLPTKIHEGAQGKHIQGHPHFQEGRSILTSNPQQLLDGVNSGIYPLVRVTPRGNPIVNFGQPIGIHQPSGRPTSFGQIHHGKLGGHIVPASPQQF